tara:strand:- start:11276 stop:11893 length:618 start_codon:yes stop_codon:yes gene_type:complete
MEKINIKSNDIKNFIGSWRLDNNDIINETISFFNKNHERQNPSVDSSGKINKKEKDFLEITITPKEIKEEKLEFFSTYVEVLRACFQEYKKNWNFLQSWEKMYLGEFKIEKYLISGHHLSYHCDINNINSSHKVFSWVIYLNDFNEDEGSVDFLYQGFSIRPKKGSILIFPADWTHINRENVMKENEKFVLRGSFHFPDTLNENE